MRWDTRAKYNFAIRSGGTKNYEIAVAIEDHLRSIGYPNVAKIKRSTIYRLLGPKKRQKMFGISLGPGGVLEISGPLTAVNAALVKVADDVVSDELTLKDLLNSSGVENYLEKIKDLLSFNSPKDESFIPPEKAVFDEINKKQPIEHKRRPALRDTLISNSVSYSHLWSKPQLGKIEKIWIQLQFNLKFSVHEVSIPIVLRVLIECVTYHALEKMAISRSKSLGGSVKSLSDKLVQLGSLDPKQGLDIDKFVSDAKSHRALEALNRTVHSPSLTISKLDMLAIWVAVEPLLVKAIEVEKQ